LDTEKNTRTYAAAGGVVVAPGGKKVLVLLRPDRPGPSGQPEMRLPKGHIEPGESASQAAFREVREEAGLSGLMMVGDLGQQTVEFDWKDVHHVRRERYFLMTLPTVTDTSRSEEQFEPLWLSWEDALSKISYEAEREWIRRARSAWKRQKAL
jgi:8-oxo-dGTP pyrophosphatase MutT (NUDIX family)